jgi:TonB-linked SusC/RagA family outer membrane protein
MKNNYRRSYAYALSFALFLTYNSPIFSQNLPQKTISGIITDGAAPLSGVNVLVKNSARGSISDLEGQYSVSASANDTLVFTYVGYKTQEVAVGSGSILNVMMQVDAQALDAVVINAGYYKVSDREKTGSITRITAAEIENQPVSNPLAAMQGRMTGVNIVQTTGLASGGYEVRIRGQNSIAAGNDPLYIIDGIPYDSQTMGFSTVGATTIPGGNISPLSLLNPQDIASIEVLKDADATAIYGSRGANGVILITTKKGKEGKTAFSLSTYTGMAQVANTINYMKTDQYLKMRREAFANDGFNEYPEDAYDVNGTWDPNRYTDWQKELIGGTAYLTNAQATVSGGNGNTRFLLSGGYHKETTVFPKDFNYKRLSVHANLDHTSTDDKFQLYFSANYAVEQNDLPGMDLTQLTRFLAPNAPQLYDSEGNLNFENGTFANPLAELEGKYLTDRKNLITNARLSYRVFPELTLITSMGYTTTGLAESRTSPNTKYDPSYGISSSYSSIYNNRAQKESWLVEPQIKWNKVIGNSSLDVLVGASYQKQTDDVLSHFARGFANNSLIYNLAAANTLSVNRDALTEYKYQAFFGRINYTLANKYILNLTGRRDGSSRFGDGKRFANFGAVGAAWLFSEEAFIKKNASFLSLGKLRASYGITGNDQIGNYQYLETYSATGTLYDGVSGLQPTRIFNPDFGWETNKKFSGGLDLGFFRDRINLVFEYYNNRSSNQLVGLPLPGTTGFPSIQANLGAVVENSGLEFSLNTHTVKTRDWNWDTGINLSVPKNKLIAFPNLENSTYANQYVVGQSLNIKKLYHVTGVDPETGVYQFEDYNGDGEISAPEDRQYIVDTAPKWYGGINNSVSYKNLELNFLFQFTKRDGYNYVLGSASPGEMANQPDFVTDQWQNEGDQSQTQLFTAGYNFDALIAHSRYMFSNASITDASFVRLHNASLTYSLPQRREGSLNCKIYLQGENLLLFTKFNSGDPEQLTGFLPPLRKLTMGFQLTL